MKNRYHPLLKQKYFLGLLTDSEASLIRRRTLHSWKVINQSELVGFNPRDPLITHKEIFTFAYKYEHVRKLLKVYMTLFSCFRCLVRSLPEVAKKLRENKMLILKAYKQCKNLIKSEKFETLTGISAKKIVRWQNEIRCEKSFLDICKTKNPAQLTFQEQGILTDSLSDPTHEHLFICDIWAKLVRTGQLHCKLSTFYKYARIAVRKLNLRRRKRKNVVHSILARHPYSVLHMDCTVLRVEDGGKWYVHIIYDNFSKAILGIKAMLVPNSYEVSRHLKGVINEYKLHNKRVLLYCDGGPENKKHVDLMLSAFPKIKKLVTSFSNGIHNNMIESFNSKFKRKMVLFINLARHEGVPRQLSLFKNMFNNAPQALIGTLTPNEVLAGAKPWKSVWSQLQNNIEKARKERVRSNLLSCCRIAE